jgi:hypothetical protein
MTLAFDIETQMDMQRPSGQRLTCASLVEVETGRLRQFDESTALDLISTLLVERVIGFNIVSFDLRVMSDYIQRDLTVLPQVFDIYRDVQQRSGRNDISLDELSAGTLGHVKPSHGRDLYALGQIKQLRIISANGTREIAAIYRFGLNNQFVRWIDSVGGFTYEIQVNWR